MSTCNIPLGIISCGLRAINLYNVICAIISVGAMVHAGPSFVARTCPSFSMERKRTKLSSIGAKRNEPPEVDGVSLAKKAFSSVKDTTEDRPPKCA